MFSCLSLKLIFLALIAGMGNANPLTPAARQNLRTCLSGGLTDPTQIRFHDDADFVSKDVKHFNLNLPYKPLAVVYPTTKAEISETVRCAAKYERKIQARSGGKDFINKGLGGADDAIVVDMKYFNSLSLDENTGIATVGPGNQLKSLVEGLNKAGRFMPHGSSGTVGVGGHIAVGGIGYTSRENGLAIDVLTEIEVVLANGTVVEASKNQNSDVFWAMSGAGASFGVATEFKFQTKRVPEELTTFTYNYSTTDRGVLSAAVRAYHKLVTDQKMSRKLSGAGLLSKNNFFVNGVYLGARPDFEALKIDEELPLGTSRSVNGGVSWINYMNSLFRSASSLPEQAYSYAKDLAVGSTNVPSDATIERFVDFVQTTDAGLGNWLYLFDWYGGAVNDVPQRATPFPHRDLFYFLSSYVHTDGETSETTMNFIDDSILILQNNIPSNYLHYAGVPNLRLNGKPQEEYWGSNVLRLEHIKNAVDPDDVFSAPQNIKPRRS